MPGFSFLRLSSVRLTLGALALTALTAACSEPPPPPPPAAPPAPPVKTAEQRAQRYIECWGYFNNKAWDQFQDCYTDTATSEEIDSAGGKVTGRAAIIAREKSMLPAFPDRKGDLQLVLQNSANVLGVAIWTGTNDGPMPGPDGKEIPATHKKAGLPMVHMVQWDATGSQAVRDAGIMEEGTLMAQLGLMKMPARKPMAGGGSPTVVIAKNDDNESKNVAATRAMIASFNAHDVKALDAMSADNYKLIEIGRPADMDKKAAAAGTKELFTGLPDAKITPDDVWAAGDYVVVTGTMGGTNSGKMPTMGVMKPTGKTVNSHFVEIFKFAGGKVTEDWLFYNGAAMAAQLGLK